MPSFQSAKPGVPAIPILLVIFMVSFLAPAYSQDDCGTKIQEAQKFYDQGMIEDIPSMLAPCMADGFTRLQRIEAYKLIVLSYLFDDNQFDAERTMLEFLKKFPEYEIMPNDPVEFVYLFESYRTSSVFSFGVTTGLTLTDPRVIEPYSVFDMRKVSQKTTMRTGFHVGVGIGRYINRRMFINIEFNFAENRYSFTDEIITPLSGIDGINSVTYTEYMYKAELPLSIAYEFNLKKIHYFVRTGISFATITSATGLASRKYSDEMPAITGESIDVQDYRKDLLYGAIVGTGMRYKVPRGVLTLEFRANIGLNNIVNPDSRFKNHQQIFKSYYIDDDFSLNVFSLSAGYYFSFYSPKKQADK